MSSLSVSIFFLILPSFGMSSFCGVPPPFLGPFCPRCYSPPGPCCFCCRPVPFVSRLCCNCPPPVVALVPAPSPCTACHSVARPVPPPFAPSFLPQQQFLPFPPHGHQLIMSSDFNGVSAAVGGEKAAQIPIGPTEAQQQIQPIIYVIESGGGGRILPLANESAGAMPSAQQKMAAGEEKENTKENEGEENATEESTKTTTEEILLAEEEGQKEGNSTEMTTTKKKTEKRKVNLGIKSGRRRITVKTTTNAEGGKRRENLTKAKHFDGGEGDDQIPYDYGETKSVEDEEPSGKSSAKKIAASKLFEIEMKFMARRDKLLRKLLEEMKRNSRRKRISNDESTKECNNGLMARIMGSAIVEESSISKRLIKRALKYSFPDSQFDVICAAGGVFSYAIYGRQHCEVKRKGVTCLAFK